MKFPAITWQQGLLALLVAVLLYCLLFGCRFGIEFLENKHDSETGEPAPSIAQNAGNADDSGRGIKDENVNEGENEDIDGGSGNDNASDGPVGYSDSNLYGSV